ncbi:MAG: signal recognition particle-docking protein FtsY [Candidatus Micrarchaeales archaeon]|nr:signal recognition particle-docking protein FtsY [Candidatus Micrarchaeales archaeon]
MFDGLKRKLSEAVKIFAKKEEKEIEKEIEAREEKADVVGPKAAGEIEESAAPKQQQPAQQAKQEEEIPSAPELQPVESKREVREEKKGEEKGNKELLKLSLKTKIKGVFTSNVALGDREIDDFLENLKLSLLQSDVSFEATEAFLEDLRGNLKSTKLDSRNIQGNLIDAVRKSLFDILAKSGRGVDIKQFVKERVAAGDIPVKILFLGPNGTGKTTTIAKIAHTFKSEGISSVMSASDTFRAAAIEQTEHHAAKVGVPVIKSKYGADPASIAFDAIAYAKSHSIQAVLIDSAGRQETNKNLIKEMEKMVRVAQPNITIFVGESTTGNQLSEQVREFAKFMRIDGIILTKLDVDAKGGNAISIAYTTGIPLLYLGTGESYDALVRYTPDFIVDSILPNN